MDGFKNSTRMKYMTEGGTYNERGRRATMGEIAAEDRRMSGRKPAVEGVSSRPTDSSGRRASDAELGMTSSAKKPVGPSSVAVSKVLAGMAKPMKKNMGGGVNSKLGKAIENAKAAMTAAPRAKSTLVDMLPKNSPQKPSSGNPLMGGMNRGDIVASKPTPVGSKPAPRVSILDTIRGAVKTSPGNPLTGGNMNRNDIVASKPTPPTRGPSMSPAFSDRPMIRRSKGGLSVMPKGKC